MSQFNSPEETFDDEQLARFYAVGAAGPVQNSGISAADSVVFVARWILDGDEAGA